MNHASRAELLKAVDLFEALDRACSRLENTKHLGQLSSGAKTRAQETLERATRAALDDCLTAARDYLADAETDPQVPAAQGAKAP